MVENTVIHDHLFGDPKVMHIVGIGAHTQDVRRHHIVDGVQKAIVNKAHGVLFFIRLRIV